MGKTQFSLILDNAAKQLTEAGVERVTKIFLPPSAQSIGGVVVRVNRANPDPQALRGNPVNWNTTLQIDVFSRFGSGNQDPDEGINNDVAAVWAALFADESLGGVADGLLPGPITWDYSDPEQMLAKSTVTVIVLHQVSNGEL